MIRDNGENSNRWQLKKELTWGDIGAWVSIVVVVITWGASLDKRIAVNTSAIARHDALLQTMDAKIDSTASNGAAQRDALRAEIRGDLKDIKADIRDVNVKLDQMIFQGKNR